MIYCAYFWTIFKHEDFSVAASVLLEAKKEENAGRVNLSIVQEWMREVDRLDRRWGESLKQLLESRGIVELMEHWNINEDHHVWKTGI